MGDCEPFKVVIAGGGIAGLALANALQKAGVDFVVLEKGKIAPQIGASICLLPHTGKILEQLGVWKDLCSSTLPLTNRHHLDEHGRLFDESPMFREAMEKFGRPTIFVERNFCLDTLYGTIEDRSKLRENASVISFSESEHGIAVLTSDGETINGSILVATDGVHSTVRRLIADSVLENDPARSRYLTQPFTSSYRVVFGTSPNRSGDGALPSDGVAYHVYYRNSSGISTVGSKDLIFWFLFIKEKITSTTPDCPRYTESDAVASIEKYGNRLACPGYSFLDLWRARVKGGMVAMEEGVVEGSWNNNGRVVLVGDSVTKTTVNGGLGGNLAIEGICNLVNELVPLIRRTPMPTTRDLVDAFKRYEQKQRPRAEITYLSSNVVTRYESMDTLRLRFLGSLSV